MPTSNFQPIRLLDPDFWYKFTYWMANSTDPDQLANWSGSTLFPKAEYIGFSRTRVKKRLQCSNSKYVTRYSWLSLSRPLLSRSYHLCRTDFQVPIIFLIYLLYFSFAYVELLLCRHFGYLVHHFQSLNKFFTVFTTAYLELGPWRRKTKCKMRRRRSLS